MTDCTTASWDALDIQHSTTPANLPVAYRTEVTVQCIEHYSTVESVVTCSTNELFTYTEDKPSCQSGNL